MTSLTNTRLRFAALGLAVVVALALLMPACGRVSETPTATTPSEKPATPSTDNVGELVSVQALTANPTAYYNRQVAVTGVVRQIVAPDAFVLSPTTTSPASETILVAGKNLPVMRIGEPISVVGTPQAFDFTTFNNEIGKNWNQAAFTPYVNRSAIMATEVTSHAAAAPGQTGAGTPGQ